MRPGQWAIDGKIYVVGGQGEVTLAANEAYTP